MQPGFRKGHSAHHCFLVLIEKRRKVFDKLGFSDLLLTYLSKLSDCIDHELINAKLHAYGFDIKSLELIDNYLHDSTQRVKINSSFRHWRNVELGILQRSNKVPPLVNIYICDLFFDISDIDIANYADDTTPYALDLKLENIAKLLEEKQISFLSGFQTAFLKQP